MSTAAAEVTLAATMAAPMKVLKSIEASWLICRNASALAAGSLIEARCVTSMTSA
jgi:hypothetical protein